MTCRQWRHPCPVLDHAPSCHQHCQANLHPIPQFPSCLPHPSSSQRRHPQSAMLLQTGNSTSSSIANDTVKNQLKQPTCIYWICWHRLCQGQFHIFWHPGTSNQTDYFTKHHHASIIKPCTLCTCCIAQSTTPIIVHTSSHCLYPVWATHFPTSPVTPKQEHHITYLKGPGCDFSYSPGKVSVVANAKPCQS